MLRMKASKLLERVQGGVGITGHTARAVVEIVITEAVLIGRKSTTVAITDTAKAMERLITVLMDMVALTAPVQIIHITRNSTIAEAREALE